MKKKIIYIIISIVTIIILFFGVKYLFITRIDIDDIKSGVIVEDSIKLDMFALVSLYVSKLFIIDSLK